MAVQRTSFVGWEGPSLLDGAPVRVLFVPKSSNRKTGPMWQCHILRADMSPVEAIASGNDASICGGCVHRGTVAEDGSRTGRSCYVVYAQGPQSTWKKNVGSTALPLAEVLAAVSGEAVRIGAYGDPAAVPLEFWQAIAGVASMWTAYTHQWPTLSADWAGICMASVDSLEEADAAHAAGWRTFRVGTTRPGGREIVCPNVTTGRQCVDCGACDGTRMGSKVGRVSIVIAPHGSGAKYVSA